MKISNIAAIAALGVLCAAPAKAAEIGADSAIGRYCEPLLLGSAASQVRDLARADGLEDSVVAGQPVLRKGELLVALSDSPRVCFVQAPPAITLAQGFAMADAWAKSQTGAIRSPATRGPDGAPVRGWSAPARKMVLVATQQRSAAGQTVMNFILMPLPPGSAAK